MDLFGNTEPEIIRTIGFYQPFCTAMHWGKLETRWVREGFKPPFPLGKYLLYSTKEPAGDRVKEWCTKKNIADLAQIAKRDKTAAINGHALFTGELVSIERMRKEHEAKAFAKFMGTKEVYVENFGNATKIQWVLNFVHVQAIVPVEFKGKQGVGILPECDHQRIIRYHF